MKKIAKTPDSVRLHRRLFSFLALALGVCLLVSLLLLAWVFASNSGTRVLLRTVVALSGGQIQLGAVEGRLFDHLVIDEIRYQSPDLLLLGSGISMDWRPSSLISGTLDIAALSVSSVRIATPASAGPAKLPAHLRLPFQLKLDRLDIGRAVIGQLQADASVLHARTFTAISGSAQSNNVQHSVQFHAVSDWGRIQMKTQLLSNKPYTLTGEMSYQGQAKGKITTDLMEVQGKLSGTLDMIAIDASAGPAKGAVSRVDAMQADATQADALKGKVHLVIAPYKKHPLRVLQANVFRLDPSAMHANAPHALLDLEIDLHALEVAREPLVKVNAPRPPAKLKASTPSSNASMTGGGYRLGGTLAIKNKAAAAIDKHGLPLKNLYSQLDWREDYLQLSAARIELGAGKADKLSAAPGKIVGDIAISFKPNTQAKIDAKLAISGMDLSSIDSRLRITDIKGELNIQTKGERNIAFLLQLRDPHTNMETQGHFQLNQAGDSGLLNIEKLLLVAEESSFSGAGEVDFEGRKNFKLQGKLAQFNPAYWFALPKGSIDGELSLSGKLAPSINAKIQFPRLEGSLSGQKLSGVIQANWQQDLGFDVSQFELQWGRNSFSAVGQLGKENNALILKLNAEDLALLSAGTAYSMNGKAQIQAKLSGKLAALSVDASAHAENLLLRKNGNTEINLLIAELDAGLKLEPGEKGAIALKLSAKQVQSIKSTGAEVAAGEPGKSKNTPRDWIAQLSVNVDGRRDAHRVSASVQFDRQKQFSLAGEGGLDMHRKGGATWRGNLDQLKLSGIATTLLGNGASSTATPATEDLQLQGKAALEISRDKFTLGQSTLSGSLGRLDVGQFEWTPSSISSRGSASEFKVLNAVNLLKPQQRLIGDLRVGMQWNVQLKDSVRGEVTLKRESGDLYLNDADGSGQEMALGMSELQILTSAGGLIAGSDAERVRVSVTANGARLGHWKINAETQLRKLQDKWTFTSEAPIKGELQANVPELQWLASQVNANFALKGSVIVDGKFGGTISKPLYQAQIEGHRLELAIASEGLLFPNGELKAVLNQDTLSLQQLRFSNKIAFVPKLEQFQGLRWSGQEADSGIFDASGEINWRTESGAINANWNQFPVLQRKDRWLVMSGQASITQKENAWTLLGKLKADAAYFKLPKLPPPSLSSDVIVNRGIKLDEDDSEFGIDTKGFKIKADLSIDMGSHFVFVGRGLSTDLTGTLRLRSNDGATMYASGSISTNGGHYEGYGQALEIERGILKFHGSPSNPSLNVRALRKGLAVEAGVDVTGTVANPQVRLVSEPNVSDAEKLSWLVLGREPDQEAGVDASLLLTAAGALFGGDGSRNFPKELAQKLGFESFTFAPAEDGGASKLPSQTVAGATAIGSVASDNVLAAKMRLRPGLVLAVERSVTDASGGLRLMWQLSRRVKIVGYKGRDNSVDAKYSFSFN